MEKPRLLLAGSCRTPAAGRPCWDRQAPACSKAPRQAAASRGVRRGGAGSTERFSGFTTSPLRFQLPHYAALAGTCLLSSSSQERETKGPPLPADPQGQAEGGRLCCKPPLLPPTSADQEISWDPGGFPFLIHGVFVTKGKGHIFPFPVPNVAGPENLLSFNEPLP